MKRRRNISPPCLSEYSHERVISSVRLASSTRKDRASTKRRAASVFGNPRKVTYESNSLDSSSTIRTASVKLRSRHCCAAIALIQSESAEHHPAILRRVSVRGPLH